MFKTCPRCGDEFVPQVSECPDCRVALVAASDPPVRREATPPERAATALEDALVLRHGDASELRQVAELLGQAGIACAIDTSPPGAGFRGGGARGARAVQLAIYVRAQDAEAAAAVHLQWLTRSTPGAELAGPGGMLDACPGCGEPLATGSSACAACGLAFPDLQVACPECGGAVAPEAERCPHCGHRP